MPKTASGEHLAVFEVEGVRLETVTERTYPSRDYASLEAIVQAFDFGNLEDGRQYYVMELLDGLDLETLVSRQRDRGVDEEALAGLREEASAEMRAALERVLDAWSEADPDLIELQLAQSLLEETGQSGP